MEGGQKFESETQPSLTGEDGVGGVEGGGEGLSDSSEAMEGDASRVGVGDVVVVEGVGDDDGGGAFIPRQKETEVIKREEVGREARVRESEEVVERVGVAHGRKEKGRQCRRKG